MWQLCSFFYWEYDHIGRHQCVLWCLYFSNCLIYIIFDLQPKKMVAFLVLLNQLICKFKTALHDILEEVYPDIASRIFNIIPRNGFPSGPGSNTEVCDLFEW